jgi:pyruvate/2-oxoglutarate dehydrogenase complex dihydrolipoamide acyltransferase (E2) component
VVTPVVMPQMGLEVTEGTVGAIHVEPGARVLEGEPLVELETDKAMTDVPAPRDGIVRSVEVALGDTVAVGATLVLLADGEDDADQDVGGAEDGERAAAGASEEAGTAAPAAAPAGEGRAAVATAPARSQDSRLADGRIRAAPVARRAARHLGVELAGIEGTGPRGRVTLRDVELVAAAAPAANGHDGGREAAATAPSPAAPAPAPAPASDRAQESAAAPAVAASPASGEILEPMSVMRRAVARRMTQSQLIPQFSLEREVDASWLLGEKDRLKAARQGAGGPAVPGLNDLLLQAMAEMVLRHPDLGLSFVEGGDGEAPRWHTGRRRPRAGRRDAARPGGAGGPRRALAARSPRSPRSGPRLVGDAAAAACAGRHARRDDDAVEPLELRRRPVHGDAQPRGERDPRRRTRHGPARAAGPRDRGPAHADVHADDRPPGRRRRDGAAALVELAELVEGGMTWRT